MPRVRRPGCDGFGKGELIAADPGDAAQGARGASPPRDHAGRHGSKGFDRTMVRLVEKRVDAMLRRKKGLVERVVYGPSAVGWRIAG